MCLIGSFVEGEMAGKVNAWLLDYHNIGWKLRLFCGYGKVFGVRSSGAGS